MHALVNSGAIVPAHQGGWDCIYPGCVKPENMRTSDYNAKRGKNDLLHKSPGIWSEAPKQSGHKMSYCSKCPGVRGAGMIDFVDPPRSRKQQADASHHACRPSKMLRHLQYCGVKHNLTKLTQQMKERRIVLASHGIPHVRPPSSCALFEFTLSPETHLKEYRRVGCPINLNYKKGVTSIGHTLRIFSENDVKDS